MLELYTYQGNIFVEKKNTHGAYTVQSDSMQIIWKASVWLNLSPQQKSVLAINQGSEFFDDYCKNLKNQISFQTNKL